MTKSRTAKEARATDALNPSEFGHLESTQHLYRQQPVAVSKESHDAYGPYTVLLLAYIHFMIMVSVGHIRDFFSRHFNPEFRRKYHELDGYAPLLTSFDSLYTRRLKDRLAHGFSRPTTGVPGRMIKVMDRRFVEPNNFQSPLEDTGEWYDCINLSSYNYLGFAQSVGKCADAAQKTIKEMGLVSGASRFAGGTTKMHVETEEIIAEFMGKEAAMLYSMGYATNANFFANIVDKKCLVLSDELNHASIRTGVRMSGATTKVFPHNDMEALEKIIREQIAQGQPRSHRPWKKILIVVEGLYSMEGTMAPLAELVALREKYRVMLFVDEAHSVGAMGPHGKGVCDYFGVDPKNIDILMGTFTKSFGATGGYIAGSKELIRKLRVTNMANVYAEGVTPPVLAQIQTSLAILEGRINPGEATERLQRLAFNTRYLRLGLIKMGFVVTGHIDSPVIPLLLYLPPKMYLSTMMLFRKKIAVVIVGYPATPLLLARIRFCMSSALTKSDLDYVLQCMEEVGDEIWLRNSLQTDKNGKRHRKSFAEIKDQLLEQALDPNLTLEDL